MAFPKQIKAIHIGQFLSSLSEIKVSSIPFPNMTPSTILIRVTHVSPTHVDILYAQGKHQNNQRHAKPPFILGMDFAGTIVSASIESKVKAGDSVYGSYFGAFTEYITLDEKSAGGIRKVPKGWTNQEACAVGASGAISLGCFYRAGLIKKDDWVLVTGASGGLGVIAVQVAKALGAKVIALVGNDEKAKVLKNVGIDACVSYNEEDWEKKVLDVSDGGVSVVYDAVGLVERSLRCCRFGGTVVIVGFAGRGGDMEKLKVNRILLKGAGVVGYRFGEHGRRAPAETAQIWSDFDRMVDSGAIKSVIYDKAYHGLGDIQEALLDMDSHKTWGRAVVAISPPTDTTKARI